MYGMIGGLFASPYTGGNSGKIPRFSVIFFALKRVSLSRKDTAKEEYFLKRLKMRQ